MVDKGISGRWLGRIALAVAMLAAVTACSNESDEPAAPTVSRSAVQPSDVQPAQFPVTCRGRAFTLLGFPISDGSIPAFLSSTGVSIAPATFHVETTVTDREGIVVFRRVDDSPKEAASSTPLQSCSFTLYSTDRRGNTFTGRGTAMAAFARGA